MEVLLEGEEAKVSGAYSVYLLLEEKYILMSFL